MLSSSRVQTLARQDATNSRGFKEGVKRSYSVGERVRVKADAKLPKKVSYARCCTGVVTRIERLVSVQLDGTQNFETHCILVKPEWLENLPGQTCVAESVLVSPTRDASIQNSTSLLPATQTTMLKISCSSDTQEPPASKTCDCGHRSAKAYQQLSLLQQVPLVSPSPFRENGLASMTSETVSPQLLERSPTATPGSGASKTSPVSSPVPSNLERELGHILLLSSVKWPESGTMSSGFVSQVGTLPPPGVEKDCLWLGAHGALSHTSRAPGLSKSESSSRAKGILGKDEVYNPEWLELSSGLPLGYSSPLELRAATELLEDDGKPSVTPSIQGLQISLSDGFSTSIQRLAPRTQDDCQQPVEKRKGRRKCTPNKKPASGSLVRCVSVKKGKEYSTWQYNYDVRDPNSKRGWKTIKEGVPKYKVPVITDAIEAGLPIPEILALLGKELQGEISS